MRLQLPGAVLILCALALQAAYGLAKDGGEDIRVVNGGVYADLPLTPIPDLLYQLADAAGMELQLSGDIRAEAELQANGKSLYRVLDRLLPEGCGFVIELNKDKQLSRLIILAHGESATLPTLVNERQRYLARQVGSTDDAAVDIMLDTLADRSLDDADAKVIAIEQLADMESKRAWESLKAGMGDADPKVRLATAKALYRTEGDEVITLIGQVYYAETSSDVRKAVAAMLVGSSHPLAQGIVRDSGVKK